MPYFAQKLNSVPRTDLHQIGLI